MAFVILDESPIQQHALDFQAAQAIVALAALQATPAREENPECKCRYDRNGCRGRLHFGGLILGLVKILPKGVKQVTDERFKTMRHIEAVRNYLNACIVELLRRAEQHDQSKLQTPEREMFDEYTPPLRASTYGSDEYKSFLKGMDKALAHHYENNCHHPEHFKNGIQDMNLIDLLEMLCDWKSSTLRHADGDIYKSIEISQKRFGYSDETAQFLKNTADWFITQGIYHHAEES